MVSAATFATLLQHPASPLAALAGCTRLPRLPMGIAMGLTLTAIVYSPLGKRSGAHMNPAMTLTFFRLGKISGRDACGYVAAQFLGAALGILIASAALRGLPADPSVNYVATVPGPRGAVVAFAAELVISFGMMALVLHASNTPRLARYTGLYASALVTLYITFEAPLSGMSMNPARTFAPAVLSHSTGVLWIYFAAPALGMLAAAEWFVRSRGRHRVRCAKLHHVSTVRCIFHCGYAAQETSVPA
jgi:aquaporin Z